MPEAIDGVPLPPPWEEQNPIAPYPGYFPDAPDAWLIHRHRFDKAKAQAERETIRVVFLGDSITEGWDKSLWNEHFSSPEIVNFAIGGDKTCQVLWRIADGLLDGLNPELIVLAIGVNSIWSAKFSPEQISKGIFACIAAIQAVCPKAKILVSAVLPCMEPADHPYRDVIRKINAYVIPIDNGKTIRFVDPGVALLEPDGTLPPSVAPDGVHLGYEGYRRVASVFVPAFKAILGNS